MMPVEDIAGEGAQPYQEDPEEGEVIQDQNDQYDESQTPYDVTPSSQQLLPQSDYEEVQFQKEQELQRLYSLLGNNLMKV